MSTAPPPPTSILGRVWRTPEYRVFLILMVLLALGFSSAFPLISLYLVRDLGAGLSTAALFFTAQALPGLLIGVLIGRVSDRWRSRIPFLGGAIIWLGVGWVILALARSPWPAIVAGAAFLSLGGVLMGQVFAALHDVMTRDGEAEPALINTLVRTGWSFGWVFGPLAGTALAAQAGIRVAFFAAAGLYLVCLLPLRGLRVPILPSAPGASPPAPGRRSTLPLLAFTALCALVVSGQTIKNSYLPIDVTEHLHAGMGRYGTVVAVSPIVELLVMPLAGILAQRVGIGRIIGVGLAMAALEYLLLAESSALWQLYVTQAMDACVVAVVMGLGVTYAQQLSPGRPGAANSIFFSSFSVAVIVGGLVGSAGVPLLGVPHIFLIPAVFSVVAWGAFLSLDRVALRHGRRARQPISLSEVVTH